MRASSGDGTPNTARARTPIYQVQDTVKTVLRLEDYGGEEESSWVLLELLGEGEAAGPTTRVGEAGPSAGAHEAGGDDA